MVSLVSLSTLISVYAKKPRDAILLTYMILAAYLGIGCFISLGKPVTRPERGALREAARHIPLDRLLLETDTYPLPGRATEPRDVAAICQTIATLRALSFDEVATATTQNFARLFGK